MLAQGIFVVVKYMLLVAARKIHSIRHILLLFLDADFISCIVV